MTTTTITAYRRLTQDELVAETVDRFGPDPMAWAFQCPTCLTVTTGADMRDALIAHPCTRDGLVVIASDVLGQQCIGRIDPAQGCDWAAFGLFKGPWEIELPTGRTVYGFPLGPPPAILAFHGDPELKAAAVARMRAHVEAGTLGQGYYQSPDVDTIDTATPVVRGCWIGCLLPFVRAHWTIKTFPGCETYAELITPFPGWHNRAATEYGLPRRFTGDVEFISDSLPTENSEQHRFAVEVLEAIPAGADLVPLIDDIIAWQDDRIRNRISTTATDEAAHMLAALRALTPAVTT